MTAAGQKEPAATRPADFSGKWRVWRARLPGEYAKADHAATIAMWLVDAPGPHAFWRCWNLTLIHLREIPGAKPAHLTSPGMTHEVISGAILPSSAPDPDDVTQHQVMHPIDWVLQFRASSDQLAIATMEACARAIAAGRIHPDSDYRVLWAKALQETADCFASGKHPLA